MDKIVPLISSGVTGPLGVLHLPRLWLKVSLEALGKLADGYPGIGQGYDMMVIKGLGLSADAVREFIASNRPTYPEFEAWITEQSGVKLDKASVQKLNLAVLSYIHDDETRKSILSGAGVADDGNAFQDAVHLNNIDDWHLFHQAVLK